MTDRLRAIADDADVIINGYCFKKRDKNVSVFNLNRQDKAALVTRSGEALETSMDDIELEIVRDYLARALKYMEA